MPICVAMSICWAMPTGPHHLLDGDVAGEEALEDAEDEHGAFAGFLEGLLRWPCRRGGARCLTAAGGR